MSSVIDEKECPECDNLHGFWEISTSGLEYFFCDKCGYSVNNENGKSKHYGGIGAYHIVFSGGGGQMGSFKTKKDVIGFEEDFKKEGFFKNGVEEKAVEVYYYFKKDGKWFIKDLILDKEYPVIIKEMFDRLERK
jgi:hypothetical protein